MLYATANRRGHLAASAPQPRDTACRPPYKIKRIHSTNWLKKSLDLEKIEKSDTAFISDAKYVHIINYDERRFSLCVNLCCLMLAVFSVR